MGSSIALGLVQNAQHLVRFRLCLLPVKANDPLQFRIATMKVSLNIVHQGLAAIPVVARRASEVLREFNVAIHNGNTTVGQQQRKRRAAHTEGPVLCRRTGRVGRACPVTVDVRSISVTICICICV